MAKELELNKERADAEKYYRLLMSKAGKLRKGSSVCLIHIGNLDVIRRILDSSPESNYIIIDKPAYERIILLLYPTLKNSFIATAEDDSIITELEKLTMKFDKIIMNPPYSKNLHLKILAEAIAHLSDKGKCVNLSPIRWLQDPMNQFKKKTDLIRFNDSILNHLNTLEVIDQKTANNCFNIGLYVNLGIYECNAKQKKNNDFNKFWKKSFNNDELSIFNKISSHVQHLNNVIEHDKRDGIRVLIALIGGNRGMLPVYKDIAYAIDGMKDGKDWTKCKNNGGYEKEEGIGIPNSIKFNTEKEAQNFYDSYKTGFTKFICNHYVTDQHIPDYWLPWMGDCINPRTNLKGYKSEWTNEDFYHYFDITEDEQKIIETTMEKYK